jgi:serine acetyltransferase
MEQKVNPRLKYLMDLLMKSYEEHAEIVKIGSFNLPEVREYLARDVSAAFDGDPAAANLDEIISSYPGIYAIMVYRLAHILHELEVPLMSRIMTEYAHNITGIDIHPGAIIGSNAFVTKSVPEKTRVSVKNPELQFKSDGHSPPAHEELRQDEFWDWVI